LPVFVGHLAVAFGAKKIGPELPLGAAVAAAFGLDLLWPVLLLGGLETVRVNPNDTAFTHLAFESYPWSHSLLMSVVWAGLAGVLAARALRSARSGWLVAGLVVSHWLLDWVTHGPDLPLVPGGASYGLGLWNSIPATLGVEGGLFCVAVWFYLRSTQANGRPGTVGLYAMLALCVGLWVSQPWAPPPPSPTAVALGALVLWLLPPWAAWADAHRVASGAS
jgi:hypothetical protein